MQQSLLFTKTAKHPPKDEVSKNAQLLEQAGFIMKLMAGVYSYLPLGLRVLRNIENIIREEMNAIGGQEVFLPALQPQSLWDKTGRWKSLQGIMYQFQDPSGKNIGLAITHEEVVAHLCRRYISSYKDLPKAIYQIQTKFRHELRPKSGLTRGREFSMKDLYSFHQSDKDCSHYYEIVKKAYTKIFLRCGLDTRIVEASGGTFSDDFSHEFQVFTASGEDTIYYCQNCSFAQNKEISRVHDGDICPKCDKGEIQSSKAIEVGNIFKLGTTFSAGVGASLVLENGKKQPVIMASYGIGPSRVMGTIIEVHHDEDGMCWPASVAPYRVHLLVLGTHSSTIRSAQTIIDKLSSIGLEPLVDDRSVSHGEKLKDADLIGIPHRCVVSDAHPETIEYRNRKTKEIESKTLPQIIQLAKS